MPDVAFGFGTPFAEQLAFFRQKLSLPSERWDDIMRGAHDRAFIVAGAMKADLITDLRKAVDKAIEKGTGFAQFQKDFKAAVKDNGWEGWTGQGGKAGEAWRARVIYQTNMATSYAAGRYQQLTDPAFLALRPYWRYKHADGVMNPRPQHAAWNNLTLPHDHPFWQTHFAPNGWGCHCRIIPVGEREYQQALAEGKATPPQGWDDRDSKGNLPGVDHGFDYAPGASAAKTYRALIDDKLIKLDAPIGAAMYEALRPVLAAELNAGFAAWVDDVFAAGEARKRWFVVGAMTVDEIGYFSRIAGKAPTTAEIAIEDRLLVGKKADRHTEQGNALTAEEWKAVPQLLATARQAYYDKLKNNVVYALSMPGDQSAKLVVELNFQTGRPKREINLARAGFKINPQALEDRTRYEPIE